ncbi:MAG: helix-turn-helix transcriptional regulator [Anaerolineae bacterium]|nr:helix-turn-helix transcriptional regulator [Anaerolineae bacterium]
MDFSEWIESEMEKRSWRPADLAKRAGLYPATLGRVLSRERQAGPDVCNAIARAFKVPHEDVFRYAGLLPPLPEGGGDLSFGELLSYMKRLSPQTRREILEYVIFRYQREQDAHDYVANSGDNTANGNAGPNTVAVY